MANNHGNYIKNINFDVKLKKTEDDQIDNIIHWCAKKGTYAKK